jgi:RNA recognition motif-containing protein
MKLALGQITEVVGPMATAGVVATVEVEVADPEEEDREDIKLPLPHFYLTHTIYINYSGGLLAKRRSWITPLPRKGVNMNIYVGNLSLEVTEGELRQEFMAFGEVLSATVMNDKYISSGQSRGYAFVEMPSQSEGKVAIAALNDKALRHMTINVIEALPLSDKKGDGSYIAKRGDWPTSRVRQRRYKIS